MAGISCSLCVRARMYVHVITPGKYVSLLQAHRDIAPREDLYDISLERLSAPVRCPVHPKINMFKRDVDEGRTAHGELQMRRTS